MSRETLEWLNENVLVGYTDTHGKAWHANNESSNHFSGAVPVDKVTDLLNFPVLGEPLMHVGESGFVPSADHQVIYRPDTGRVFSVMSSKYAIHNYQDTLVDGLERVLATGELQIGSAGLLRGGARAWVQVNLPETLAIGGDEILPFVTASTSLDGSSATRFVVGGLRAVCDNTLDLALFNAFSSYTLRHTKHSVSAFDPERIAEVLDILHHVEASISEQVDRLTDQRVSDAQWSAIVADLVGYDPDAEEGRGKTRAENAMGDMTGFWNGDVRLGEYAGTAWGALQAVNTYYNHGRVLRNMEETSRFERNYESLLSGDTGKHDAKALDAIQRHTGLVLA